MNLSEVVASASSKHQRLCIEALPKIVFSNCLDLYLKSPDSGGHQYESRTQEKAI